MKLRPLLIIGVGLAIGYVLGARAGRERYEQLREVAGRVWDNPRFADARRDGAVFARENAPIIASRAGKVARDAAVKTADAAKDATAKTAKATKSAAKKTASAAADATAHTVEVTKDVAGRTADFAKDLAERATDGAKDLAERGRDSVGRAAEAAATARDDALEELEDAD